MNRISMNILLAAVTLLIIGLSIFIPSIMLNYSDANIMGKIHTVPDSSGESYRYSLDNNDRIYILYMALSGRRIPQSEYYGMLKEQPSSTYAFTQNSKGPTVNELSAEEALTVFEEQFSILYDNGIIPDIPSPPRESELILYTASDVLEPQRRVSVWQVMSGDIKEAYLDAETGMIYGFSLGTKKNPDYFNPDDMIVKWCEYLDIGTPQHVTAEKFFMDETPYYKRYQVEATQSAITFYLGYSEGTNEIFIKIYE